MHTVEKMTIHFLGLFSASGNVRVADGGIWEYNGMLLYIQCR